MVYFICRRVIINVHELFDVVRVVSELKSKPSVDYVTYALAGETSLHSGSFSR